MEFSLQRAIVQFSCYSGWLSTGELFYKTLVSFSDWKKLNKPSKRVLFIKSEKFIICIETLKLKVLGLFSTK